MKNAVDVMCVCVCVCFTGTLVIDLKANDSDASWTNNGVTYAIESGCNDKFTVDPATGQVTTLREISTERRNYQLTVAAVDTGCPPLKSVCQLDITVVDGNSSTTDPAPPVFTTDMLVTSVAEDAPVGHVVFTCVAVNPAGRDRLRYDWSSDESRGYDVRGHVVADVAYVKVNVRSG